MKYALYQCLAFSGSCVWMGANPSSHVQHVMESFPEELKLLLKSFQLLINVHGFVIKCSTSVALGRPHTYGNVKYFIWFEISNVTFQYSPEFAVQDCFCLRVKTIQQLIVRWILKYKVRCKVAVMQKKVEIVRSQLLELWETKLKFLNIKSHSEMCSHFEI